MNSTFEPEYPLQRNHIGVKINGHSHCCGETNEEKGSVQLTRASSTRWHRICSSGQLKSREQRVRFRCHTSKACTKRRGCESSSSSSLPTPSLSVTLSLSFAPGGPMTSVPFVPTLCTPSRERKISVVGSVGGTIN